MSPISAQRGGGVCQSNEFISRNSQKIQVITKKSLGVAVVIKGDKKVIGYVSDGDIRRCKFSKNNSVMKICTKRPLYVSENTLVSKAISLMNKKKITTLLVSNEKDFKKRKIIFKLQGLVHMHRALEFQ